MTKNDEKGKVEGREENRTYQGITRFSPCANTAKVAKMKVAAKNQTFMAGKANEDCDFLAEETLGQAQLSDLRQQRRTSQDVKIIVVKLGQMTYPLIPFPPLPIHRIIQNAKKRSHIANNNNK